MSAHFDDELYPDEVDEDARRAFEAAGPGAGPSAIDAFLPNASDPRRRTTLEELVAIDIEFGWRSAQGGRRPQPLEVYVEHYPELAADKSVLKRLVIEEYRLRSRFGDSPSAKSYAERFPELDKDGNGLAAVLESAPSAADPPATTASPGDQVGRYQLLEEVGAGSFATVFRGVDPELERAVAVKVLRPRYVGDRDVLARVYREARNAAQLHHPGIVQVHEIGMHGDVPYIVTDFIDGGTFVDYVEASPTDPRQAAEWVARIAEAAHYAHEFGIVHRDIKPANILRTTDGQPVLADFGLAVRVSVDATMTQDGDVLGTPAYMSPEQARSEGRVDHRADVYSLGVILYELLCGQRPFTGTWSSVLDGVLNRDPTPPRFHRSDVPADLETICLTAMAREPERRYATAKLLAEDLLRFLDRLPIRARRPHFHERVWLWSQRNPQHATTIAVAAFVVLLIVVASVWSLRDERDRYRQQRDAAHANLYRALVEEVHSLSELRPTGWWPEAIDNVSQAATLNVKERDEAELRRLAVQLLSVESPHFERTLVWNAHESATSAVACSADGLWLAAGSKDGVIELATATDGSEIASFAEHTGAVVDVAFHPNGTTLVSASTDGTIRRWPTTARGTTTAGVGTVVAMDLGPLHALALSPDGETVAVGGDGGSIVFVENWIDEPKVVRYSSHTTAIRDICYSATGRFVLTGADSGLVLVTDVQTGAATFRSGSHERVSAIAFTRSDSTILWSQSSGWDFELERLWHAVGRRSARSHDSAISGILTTPRGVVTASHDGTLRAWRLADLTEVGVARAEFGGVMSLAPGPSPNSVAAGYAGGQVAIWELREPDERTYWWTDHAASFLDNDHLVGSRQILEFDPDPTRDDEPPSVTDYGPTACTGVAVHPDGERFVYGAADGQLAIARVDGTLLRDRWVGHYGEVSAVAAADAHWASASHETLCVWTWGGELVSTLQSQVGRLHDIAWQRGGNAFLAVGNEGVALIESLHDWSVVHVWREGAHPHAAATFVGDQVAFGTQSGELQLWALNPLKLSARVNAHEHAITAIEYVPSRDEVITAASDSSLRIWDCVQWQERIRVQPRPVLRWIEASSDGQYFACGGAGQNAQGVWSLQSAQTLASPLTTATDVAFVGDTHQLLWSTAYGAILELSLAEVEEEREGSSSSYPTMLHHLDAVVPGDHDAISWGVATRPDAKMWATGAHDGLVKLWDAPTRQLIATLDDQAGIVWSVAFSPDSRLLAAGSAAVRVWNTETHRRTHLLEGHERLVVSVVFHPTRALLLSSCLAGTIRVWDLGTSQQVAVLFEGKTPVHQIAVDGEGRWLAAACGDGVVRVWDLDEALETSAPADPKMSLPDHGRSVWTVAFDATGSRLASGAEDGRVILWDTTTWSPSMTLQGDSIRLRSLSFSPDGRRLAAGCWVGRGITWDLERIGRSLRELGL